RPACSAWAARAIGSFSAPIGGGEKVSIVARAPLGVLGLTAQARKTPPPFMPPPPPILGPTRGREPSPARTIHPRIPTPGVIARAGDSLGDADHVRYAQRGRERLAEGHTTDHPVAGHHPPGHADRLVPALAAGRVRPSDLSLGVGVTAGKALDRNVGHAV